MKNILLLGSLALALSSCATVKSSLEYSKGTQCLECGDYQGAVSHLEKACELNPDISRNHNNLAGAYMQLGEIQKGWVHSRKAVLLDPGNREAVFTFNQITSAMIKKNNLDPNELTEEQAIEFLGKPDIYSESKDGDRKFYLYGTLKLLFVNGKYVDS